MQELKQLVKQIPGIKLLQTVVRDLRHRQEAGFQPYIKPWTVNDIQGHFFFATSQAEAWYDPMQLHTATEYSWIVQHIPLEHERIIDAGAHHGHYTLLFALASNNTAKIVAVDPHESNLAIVQVNLALNHQSDAILECAAISEHTGTVRFELRSNGQITNMGGIAKVAKRLPDIMPDATIVKLDIEGAEFDVLPQQITLMPDVHTWIVEIHPQISSASPQNLIDLLREHDFTCYWLNKKKNIIESYPDNADWSTHTTVIGTKKDFA